MIVVSGESIYNDDRGVRSGVSTSPRCGGSFVFLMSRATALIEISAHDGRVMAPLPTDECQQTLDNHVQSRVFSHLDELEQLNFLPSTMYNLLLFIAEKKKCDTNK